MAQARVEKLPNGKFRGVATMSGSRRVTKVFTREGDALVWAETEMLREQRQLRRGLPAETRPVETRQAPTFGSYAVRWLALKPHHPVSYQSQINVLVEDFGDWRLHEITKSAVQRYVTRLARGDVPDERRAPSTVQFRFRLLKAILAAAIEEGVLVGPNPCHGVELPRRVETPFYVVSSAEEVALLDACLDDRDQLAVLLALYAGLRWGEIFGLQRHRLDPDHDMALTVASTAVRDSRLPQGYPKGKRPRHLGRVPQTLRTALENYLAKHDEEIPEQGLLLATRNGGTVQYAHWRTLRWKPILKRAGLADTGMTFHDLRHTYGTRLASFGMPVEEIAYLMGHKNTQTTQIYLHAAAPSVRSQWVAHVFDGGPSPVFPRSPGQALD